MKRKHGGYTSLEVIVSRFTIGVGVILVFGFVSCVKIVGDLAWGG